MELRMGCGTSSSREDKVQRLAESLIHRNIQEVGRHETITDAYQRLDKEICALEGRCPGPRLATAEAWIEHLQAKLKSLWSDTAEEGVTLDDDFWFKTQQASEDDVKDIVKLTVKLGVVSDVEKSVANEDFLATVSRKSLQTSANQYYLDMIERAKNRAKTLLMSYNQLKALYIEQDGLIASVNGGVYSNVIEERLDARLEEARSVRDKLGSILEQWRTCGLLLKTSWKAARQVQDLWQLAKKSSDEKERISLILDCRHASQASLIALECAEMALPQVDMKFVTKRQCLAVHHACVYLLTDIADDTRFNHTNRVFEAYQNNLAKAVEWLYATFEKTLKRDFNDAEEATLDLAKQLRHHRMEIFMKEIGPKVYLPNVAIDTG
ncbi:uncharacterized protein LOC119661329 isoform X2 [Hermetia illucens]|nr:uncharacterized protein LOC119661329 isoform X2 [Hermetia illucens]